MSRIGKIPIFYPATVKIKFINNTINIDGPLGNLKQKISDLLLVDINEKTVVLKVINKGRISNIMLGTFRSLINNMIKGVTVGFEKRLILIGIGFKAVINNNKLSLFIGFSHVILYKIPLGISCQVLSLTEIIIRGINIQLVGQVASDIRFLRPPDHYKGKGIRYFNEVITLKETKKK